MSLFPRFPNSEFGPLFRLLDDYASHTGSRGGDILPAQTIRSFQPKFDVKETQEAYELHGELPGIEQKNIKIEFTDPQTLTISGRVERESHRGSPPEEQGSEASGSNDTSGQQSSHQPTVEDETPGPSAGSAPESGSTAADGSKAGSGDSSASADAGKQVTTQPESSKQVGHHHHKYWVTERSVGEFFRSFSFPQHVDQDNVKASLKNGILTITVPKAKAPTNKRINIE